MPTIYTNQELISQAIDMQLEYEGYSCIKFIALFGICELLYVRDLKWEYADYTEAHRCSTTSGLPTKTAWMPSANL